MRELAIKKSQPSILPPNDEIAEPTEEKPISLKRLFHGWLRAVPAREVELPHEPDHDTGIRRVFPTAGPKEIASQAPRNLDNGGQLKASWRALTIRELLGINRATVRESDAHRHWPTDVVLTFMAAEVVTRKQERR
jgi:hypothetical protein